MDPFLEEQGGGRHLLLGNEAVSRGALEAGVVVATTYPGTPATEIGDTFFRLSHRCDRFYFEYSVNEKVALEVAAGAAVAGVRALCSMKHVGVNVASDALMTLAYLGVNGGLVLVTSDEPGCHSSQNEQDNRLYARLANLPLLEPATPQEAKDFTRYGVELSERLQLPVILRMTTRVSHMRGVVTFGDLPTTVARRVPFVRDLGRFAYNPRLARIRRKVLLTQMAEAEGLAEAETSMNLVVGEGRLGVLTSGVSFNYVRDAVIALNLEEQVRIAKLGFSYPVPAAFLKRFLGSVDRCLVVEEVEPLLEQHAKALAHEARLDVVVEGRASGRFPRDDEMSLEGVTQALADLTGKQVASPTVTQPPPLPMRPPTLCPGCSHRNTFYAAKLATRNEAIYNSDIGCYTLGQLPPLNMCDLLICMGSSVNTAGGFQRSTDRPSLAFIGDSTFFHSGMTGLVNAVHNKHKIVLVVLDNRTTAMTGHQPHPGTVLDGMHEVAPQVSIEAICKAAGADFVEIVNPADLKQVVTTFQRAVAHERLAVIISRAPCLFVDRRDEDRPVYQVDQDRCCFCGICRDHQGCGETLSEPVQLVRAATRIGALALGPKMGQSLPAKPPVAPCTETCPAHVCVQSYVSLIAAGQFAEAARAVRERLPLPATVARVCHEPCRSACTRSDLEGPVAINALKRFAMAHEDQAAVAAELAAQVAQAPARGATVGIIGAGPAGLAAAHDLRLRGFGVTVYEAASVPGGMLALGIPEYRLPRAVLDAEIAMILALGISLRLDTRVGEDISFEALQTAHDAVLVAAGAWHGVRLDVPGADADADADANANANANAGGLQDALTFLAAANLKHPLPSDLGRRALVIGGGDAALDAARMARRLGAEKVTIVYRRSREEMPAARHEITQAEEEGVMVRLLSAPTAVVREGGRVTGLTVVRTELGEPDQSGRRRPVPVLGSEETLACDTLIVAIGQRPALGFLPDTVARSKWGTLETDATGAGGSPGLFCAGDAATGPQTVIHAIAAGQRAARSIEVFLAAGRWEVPERAVAHLDSATGPSSAPYQPVEVLARPGVAPDVLAVDQRQRANEVALGFTREQALEEAARCLVCGQCAKCRVCVDTFGCPAFAVRDSRIYIDEVLCIGCGLCAQLCPNNAILPTLAGT